MRQTLRTASPRAYAAAMAGLWIDLRGAVARLDALAADLDALSECRDALPALQYDLHCAAELAAGLTPPPDVEHAHDELADALADARESTADVADALANGGVDAVAPLVWEWRGALFRVRFARERLARPRAAAVAEPSTVVVAPRTPPALAAAAVAVGSSLVLLAALLGLWLLVTLTLAATIAASVLLRP